MRDQQILPDCAKSLTLQEEPSAYHFVAPGPRPLYTPSSSGAAFPFPIPSL